MASVTVTTLGTSHGDPTPTRFNSSTLLQVQDDLYLIDAGSPVDALIKRANKDLLRLKAVFVTHMHGDHVGGLPTLYKAFIKYAQGTEALHVFLPEAQAEVPFKTWLSAMHLPWRSDIVSVQTAQPGRVFLDRSLEVRALATAHMPSFPSYAYFVMCQGHRILFSGDLSADFSEFPQIAHDHPCDLCLCECTHFDIEKALKSLAQCPIGKIVFNHVADPWHGDGESVIAAMAQKILPYPFAIAHDGDSFRIG